MPAYTECARYAPPINDNAQTTVASASLAKPGKDRTAANSAAAAGSITVTATTSVTPK